MAPVVPVRFRSVTPRGYVIDGEVSRSVKPVRSRSGSSNLSTHTSCPRSSGERARGSGPRRRRFESVRGRVVGMAEWYGAGPQDQTGRFESGRDLVAIRCGSTRARALAARPPLMMAVCSVRHRGSRQRGGGSLSNAREGPARPGRLAGGRQRRRSCCLEGHLRQQLRCSCGDHGRYNPRKTSARRRTLWTLDVWVVRATQNIQDLMSTLGRAAPNVDAPNVERRRGHSGLICPEWMLHSDCLPQD